MQQALERHYNAALADKGVNWIAKNIVAKMLEKVAEMESLRTKDGVQRSILAIEEVIETTLAPDATLPVAVTLRGISDRMDLSAGKTQIIDYKTGKVESKDVKVKSEKFADLFDGKKSKCVQLLIYGLIVHRGGTPAENILPTLYSMRNHKEGLQSLRIDESPILTTDHLTTFEQLLREKLAELWNLSEFAHSPNAQHCEYCNR